MLQTNEPEAQSVIPKATQLADDQQASPHPGINIPAIKDHMARSKVPLPLVIAVVGHRDLLAEDKQRLRKQVGAIFDELAQQYPASRPFQLLCGLAEGADRLVAHVALSKGAHLIACLPMERSLYEKDFETPESLREFVDLVDKSAAPPLAMPLVAGSTPENIGEQKRRDLQYDALAKFLVRHCHILIALWDGVEKDLLGGTSSVVALQRHGPFGKSGIDPRNPLAVPESGPVYHILTPRKQNPAPVGDLEHWRLLHHSGFKTTEQAQKHYRQVFGRMNAFNQDAAGADKQARKQSAESLLPEQVRAALPRDLQLMIERYALADSLALSYQRRTRGTFWRLIFLFGVGGVLFFELFAHGPNNSRALFLLAYLLLILGAVVIHWRAKLREIKTRHLDYRALAEGMRLQTFWKIAGLDALVCDYYLAKQRTELDWVREAIQRWTGSWMRPSRVPDWQSLVGVHWIRDQYDFFTRAAKRNHRGHARETACYKTVLALLGLIILITLATQLRSFPAISDSLEEPWVGGFSKHDLLVIVMALLPTLAAAVSAYSLKMAFSEQRKQYERMRDLYGHGLEAFTDAISHSDTPKAAQAVVFELGKEALSENGDWVLLHRERTVEIFVGG